MSKWEGDSAMAKEAKRQVGLNMRAALYEDLAKLAKDNGQTTTYVLEQAVEHYIQFIAPTQSVVRPEIMAHVRRSVDKNRKLLQLLAK
jgi:predicted transcriptional regulator